MDKTICDTKGAHRCVHLRVGNWEHGVVLYVLQTAVEGFSKCQYVTIFNMFDGLLYYFNYSLFNHFISRDDSEQSS